MPETKPVPATAKPAAELLKIVTLSDDAKKVPPENLTAAAFADQLAKKKLYVDAVRFLAHALPKREGVWWAIRSVRQAPATPSGAAATALAAAEKWVKDPSEENRRAAQPAAEKAGFGTPAGSAAMAAFWSGGSLGPPNAAPVPPDEQMTAQGVAAAVLLAGLTGEPTKAHEVYARSLADGLQVASGAARWT